MDIPDGPSPWSPPLTPPAPSADTHRVDGLRGRIGGRETPRRGTGSIPPLMTGNAPPDPKPPIAGVTGQTIQARCRLAPPRPRLKSRAVPPWETGSQPVNLPPMPWLSPSYCTAVRRRMFARWPVPSSRAISLYRARHYVDLRGLYRIFNAAEYRLYRSNVAPPAPGETPWATSPTLPATPADTFADGAWYVSVSYFDGIVDSGFLPLGPHGETYLLLTIAGGQATINPPGDPLDWRLEADAGGVVRVVGVYYEDGPVRATAWALNWSSDGSTPAAGSPLATADVAASGLAVLDYSLPAVGDGLTVTVRLQMRRDDGGGTPWVPDYVFSTGGIRSIVAEAAPPAAVTVADDWAGPLPGEE